MYESELTKFMRDFLAAHPEEIESQKKGRAIWWDKQPSDLAERSRMDQGNVPMKPYVYLDK